MIRYLSPAQVRRINEAEVGPNLVADAGLLESAAFRPQQSAGGNDAYPTIHTKAAALLESLCLNHPFIDGNKRTAIAATGMFYALNNYWLTMSQDELIELTLDIVEGRVRDVDPIADRLAAFAMPVPEDPTLQV